MAVTLASRPILLLAALSAALFLITANTYSALGVVLPAMVTELKWSWGEAGLGFTLLGVFTGASSWAPALLIRRYGVRSALLAGTAVMIAGFAALAVTRNLTAYLVGAALCGVGFQLLALIPGTHLLARLFENRARAFGIYFAIGGLGGAAGPWMVIEMLRGLHGDWRAFWAWQAALTAVAGLICVLATGDGRWIEGQQVKDAAPERARRRRALRDWTVGEALRTPQLYVLGLAYFVHLLIGASVAALSVAHLGERGASQDTAGAMLSLESFAATAVRLLGGLIGERIDPRWLLALAQAALVIGVFALAGAHDVAGMSLYAVATGTGFGLTVLAVSLLLIDYYGDKHNLEIFSLTAGVGALSAFGPLIGGLVRDRMGGFALAFQGFGLVAGVALLASLALRPPSAQSSARAR